MSFDTKPESNKAFGIKKSRKLKRAEKCLKNAYRNWKACGKPKEKENKKRADFLYARSNLQRVTRYEDNLKYIRDNSYLMHADQNDKNKVFARMKASRGAKSCPHTLLISPAGSYTGEDILEGFAADSEMLGKAKGECKGQ